MNDIELLQELASHAKSEGAWNIAEQVESIATKYESMARAVLWAYDMATRFAVEGRIGDYQLTVSHATGKHPSDWTRDGLMEYLGIAKEADE